MRVKVFTFNEFYENTYILYDATGECIIVDPGCNNTNERRQLNEFVESNHLTPVMLVNTHCHIDHVLGNKYVSEKWKLPLHAHNNEKEVLKAADLASMIYGISYDQSPDISILLEEGDTISFGNTTLKILFTPGHSPGSISLFHSDQKMLIAGDVLFQGSIGRTDLPGGEHNTLLQSIITKFFTLPDDTVVFPGHGDSTTIGIEKATNPFF